MKLTIFGATGRIGTRLVEQALDQGHEVVAVVRDPARLAVPAQDRLRVVTADVADPDAVLPAVTGADAVLSALGPRGTGPTTIQHDGARSALKAMRTAGVRRYLMVSAAGLVVEPEDGPVTRLVLKPLLGRVLRNSFADLRRAEEEVRAADVDWTIVRPPRLTDKDFTGRYRIAYGCGLRGARTISRADVAACMLRLIDDDAAVRRHVTVAY
jgi:putative NADH-flavin reductase